MEEDVKELQKHALATPILDRLEEGFSAIYSEFCCSEEERESLDRDYGYAQSCVHELIRRATY